MDTGLDLVVEYMDAARLCPFGSNARTHSKKQIRQLADSIRTFGFTNPILIDDTRTILAGHGRVEAAKLLGMTSIPCVRLSNMTPAQKRAYVIADNQLALNAGWDEGRTGGSEWAAAKCLPAGLRSFWRRRSACWRPSASRARSISSAWIGAT